MLCLMEQMRESLQGLFESVGSGTDMDPRNSFMSRKNSMTESGWKLSQAASGRYFMDFKQKIMTKTEQNAFIEV